jgi:hypothetical protein
MQGKSGWFAECGQIGFGTIDNFHVTVSISCSHMLMKACNSGWGLLTQQHSTLQVQFALTQLLGHVLERWQIFSEKKKHRCKCTLFS